MTALALIVVAIVALAYGLVSRKLSQSIVTAPMVFTAVGFLLYRAGALEIELVEAGVYLLAEVTLMVVLFSDAIRINLRSLRRDHNLPVRMLLIGLPLGIVFGTVVASLMWPGMSLGLAAVIGAILVPTDAALGQAVVTMQSVPVRLRQTLNIESGLNDGLALPFVLVAAAVASEQATGSTEWLRYGLMQITLGPLVGVVVGLAGGWLIDRSVRAGWCEDNFDGIVLLALPILAYLVAKGVGGNGFLACFVAGMAFRYVVQQRCHPVVRFVENEGQLLVLATFVLFGVALVPVLGDITDYRVWLYAILSLTVIRMAAIGLSLVGTGLRLPSILFLGWFGPRGLASILYVLLVLEVYGMGVPQSTKQVVVATVLLSIIAHGVTAVPAARRISRKAARWRDEAPDDREMTPVSEMPTRT
jgi:NhaP-type Na+/H+ or K+/H+ antiporter